MALVSPAIVAFRPLLALRIGAGSDLGAGHDDRRVGSGESREPFGGLGQPWPRELRRRPDQRINPLKERRSRCASDGFSTKVRSTRAVFKKWL